MKVREVLTPLSKEALKRLCHRRGLQEVGRKDEIRRRLTHSYHGDLSALVHDLRRRDMLTVASEHSDSVEFPAGLRELPVSDLRESCLAVFEARYVTHKGPRGVATEDGGDLERESERPDGRDFDIALFATGCGGGSGVGHVDEKSLAKMAKDADSVTVLSAYYVPRVLETIAGACRGDVKIVLNGLGGRRLNKQVRELEKLQDKLRRRSRSAKIRLAFAEGVFHTKFVRIRHGTGCGCVDRICECDQGRTERPERGGARSDGTDTSVGIGLRRFSMVASNAGQALSAEG